MKRDEEGGGHRHARLQDLLFEELCSLFDDDVNDPDLEGAAIVAVVLSVDYRHLRVHYALPVDAPAASDGRRVERALGRVAPFLRRNLGAALDLKATPDLRFVREPDLPAGHQPGDEREDEA